MKILSKLDYGLKLAYGRSGKILCFTKGSKKLFKYRFVDFYFDFLLYQIFIYLKYIHDFFRNAKLILCMTITGFFFYIIGPNKQKFPRYFFITKLFHNLKYGQASILHNLSEGDFIFNFSFYKSYRAQICRSAGKYAHILKLSFLKKYALIRLKNGTKLLIPNYNNVFYGVVNNEIKYNLGVGKAGYNRNRGFKPIVRGIAMNPIDHPNGGRTPGGKVYRSFSFRIARSRKKTCNVLKTNFFRSNS